MNDEQSIRSRLDFIGIDSATRNALQELKPLITRVLPGILDKFYASIVKYPRIAKLFPNDGVIRHAKQAQIAHWTAIATGRLRPVLMALRSVTRPALPSVGQPSSTSGGYARARLVGVLACKPRVRNPLAPCG